MNLHARDEVGNGGSGVLVTKPGEVEVARTRSARRWHLGGRRYRVGCGIGPAHYCADPFDPPGLAAPDAWAPIDLRHTLSARSGVSRTMSACGYATDLATDYTVTVRRGGCAVHLAPIALEWRNAAGQTQLVATPKLGLPVTVDEDGLWVLNAFGKGIDWGLRLWPDMARPVVRIADPAALFAGFRAPTINATGLRLCKVLSVGWRNGQPDRDKLFKQAKPNRAAGKRRRTGAPDERIVDPGVLAVRSGSHDALWFHEARAWDAEAGYALTADWQRHGAEATVALGLPAEIVAKASGALCLDTTMAEEQVGASADDATRGYGATPYFSLTGVNLNVGYLSSSYPGMSAGMRFTPPIPQGATINTAAVTVVEYGIHIGTPVNTRLRCEKVSDAAQFSNQANWDGRFPAGVTTAVITYDNVEAHQADTAYTLPDISAAVDEVVKQATWVASNGLLVFWDDYEQRSTAIDGLVRRPYAYNGSATNAAKFNATYTEAATGQPYALRVAGVPHMGRQGFRPGRG